MSMESVLKLYSDGFKVSPDSVAPVAGAGSNRKYFRLRHSGMSDMIGTVGTDRRENNAFIYLSGHFRKAGLPVPEIVGVDSNGMTYLQTDVGSVSLYDALAGARESGVYEDSAMRLLENAVGILADFHKKGSVGLDFGKCMTQEMGVKEVMHDLYYFMYCFLKPSGLEFDEYRLESEFEALAAATAARPADGVMLRDYQSRNIMLDADGRMSVIDFQGARRGRAVYDLVSLLWQSRLQLPVGVRRHLVSHYAKSVDVGSELVDSVPRFVLLRTLQTLGTYGFRGLVERKEMFVKSIPEALRTLNLLPDSAYLGLPYLRELIRRVSRVPRFSEPTSESMLTVTVMSFAYKMGLPVDPSGNGGGFVFDCRAIHNPGRYAEYRALTGRDKPVRDFLEDGGEAEVFLKSAFSLVDNAVERYLSRGFSSLMVCCGCTGGRHRSVYCAERIAAELAERFAGRQIRIRLVHREQHIDEFLLK